MTFYQCIEFHSVPMYTFRYAPDKPFIAQIKKGSYSVNTGDSVAFLNFALSLMALYL